MRIERLHLERFGSFTDASLDFAADANDFHIICGPNEAGKTTVLRALGDLLFGIPQRSPHNFLHDYRDLRIGAEIVGRDAGRLAFWRRKGTSNTLLDRDGGVLEETVLARFLGGVGRDLFETLFALDHEALRRGGDDILQARGEIGQSLFEAGAGVAGLGRVLQDLDKEADDLFTPRQVRSKPFYAAAERYREATRQAGTLSLAGDEWQSVHQEIERAEADLANSRRSLATLEAERARAERIRRVRPLLAELAELEAGLAACAAAPELPESAGEEHARALRDRELAHAAMTDHERERHRIEIELRQLQVADEVIAVEAEIKALYQLKGDIHEKTADLPKREAERRQLSEQARELRHEIGTGDAGEGGPDSLPPRTRLQEIRDLVLRRERLDAERRSALEQVRKSDTARDETGRLLAALGGAVDTAPFAAAIADVKSKGDLDAQLAKATAAAERAAGELAVALAAQGLWQGDAESLARVPVPDMASVERFEDRLVELTQRARQLTASAGERREEIAELERQIARLTEAGALPTAEALAWARDHRQAGWRLIETRYIAGEALDPAAVAAFDADRPLPDAYQAAVGAADDVADRRNAEAERVAAYERLRDESARGERRLAVTERELETVAEARRRLEEEWRSAWQSAGITPLEPRAMATWLERRAVVADALARFREAAGARDQLADEIADSRRAVLAALAAMRSDGRADDDARLRVLMREAERRLDDLTAAQAERRNLRSRQAEQEAAGQEARDRLAANDQDLAQWQERWAEAVTVLGRRPQATPAEVAAALNLVEELRERQSTIANLDHRIKRIREDIDSYEARVARLTAAVAPDLAGRRTLEAVEAFFEQLQEVKRSAERRRHLERDLKRCGQAYDDCAARMKAAEARLEELRRQAGCREPADLPGAIAAAERRRGLTESRAAVLKKLRDHGDGMTLTALVEEAQGSDPDQLAGAIAGIRQQLEALTERCTALGASLQQLRDQRREMERGRGAAAAAQDAAEALADLRDAAERHLRLKAAALLLRGAIERYRRESQGPLLRRGAELFRRLTLGSFDGLGVEYDDNDRPLLPGIRPGGARVDVAGMSEGTRDQLYLALRLAAIERYVEAGEPLPFVADDLLVNFDDERAAAALAVLADISRRTQVLFFTHHPHLAALAAERLGTAAPRLHTLPAAVSGTVRPLRDTAGSRS